MTSKPKIVVTNRVFPETLALLGDHATVEQNHAAGPWSPEEVRLRCRDAFGILAFMTDMIDRPFVDACPDLRIVGAALKGYDNIDVDACTDAGVWVSIVPDLLTVPTAELAVGLLLSLGRSIVAADRKVRTSGFSGWRPEFYGAGLASSTVGILGFGCVGRAIAERLVGFQCTILACDASLGRAPGALAGQVAMAPRDRLLAESDFLVLALPLTGDTFHILDRDTIAKLKPGARVVNPARGSLVDEAAMADALEAGRVAGYAADVFECEDWARDGRPSAIEPRLRSSAATVLTPHIGSAVVDVRRQIERAAAESIIDVICGRAPRCAVNSMAGAFNAQPPARQNVSHGS